MLTEWIFAGTMTEENMILETWHMPFLKAWESVFLSLKNFIFDPFRKDWKVFWKNENNSMDKNYLGLFYLLIPLTDVTLVLLIILMLINLIMFISFMIFLSLIFTLIGLIPAFICIFGVTGITVIRLPINIFKLLLVTYRTVMLSFTLKLANFVLIPVINMFIPPVMLVILILYLPKAIVESFGGYPHLYWKKIAPVHLENWKRFATQIDEFTANYGHESGIPDNWDGTVYGMVAFDPVTIIFSVILYIIGVIPTTTSVASIFIIKAIPIYLESLNVIWSNVGLGKFYELEKNTVSCYSQWNICASIKDTMETYFNMLENLNPSKLWKLMNSYNTDCPVCNVCPQKLDLTIICLFPIICAVFAMWTCGAIILMIIPPLAFLLLFLLWVVVLPEAFLVLPLAYICGWIGIIFIFPVLYVIFLIFALCLPFIWAPIVVGIGSSLGPFLALKIPYMMLRNCHFNPIGRQISIYNSFHYYFYAETGKNAKRCLKEVVTISDDIDRQTAKISLCKLRLNCNAPPDTVDTERDIRGVSVLANTKPKKPKIINYWDQFVERMKEESLKIQTINWISPDDVMGVSSTATVAIPGVTIGRHIKSHYLEDYS